MSANTSLLDQLSLGSLKIQLPSSIAWVTFGLFGSVGNLLLFSAILKNKKLRTNFYLCQMHLAIADTLMCLSALIVGLKRIYLTNSSPAQAISIAVDRLFCVAAPVQYRKIRTKHLQMVNVVLWIIPFVVASYFATFIQPTALIPTCVVGNIWFTPATDAIASLGIVLSVTIVVVYVALMIALACRLVEGRQKGTSDVDVKKTIQFRAAMTSFMILIVYMVCFIGGEIFHLEVDNLPIASKAKMSPFTIVFLLGGSVGAFIISVGRSSELSNMFTPEFCRKKIFVSSMVDKTIVGGAPSKIGNQSNMLFQPRK